MSRKINLLKFTDRIKIMLTITIMSIFSAPYAETAVLGEVPKKTPHLLRRASVKLNIKDSVSDSLQIYKDSVEQLRADLIKEVNDYIDSVAPKSKMTAEYIVEKCEEHDFDITLLLSQGHLETHFATCGSNNCFGLYVKKRYSHPNKSVDDYIELMQSRYVKNRTTEQLIAANFKMENSKKYGYSSCRDYGNRISSIRKNIIKKTDIKELFEELMEMNEQIAETYKV